MNKIVLLISAFLTGSGLWKYGRHYEHWACQDLTDEIPDAPHTSRVFTKFRIIGKLKV